MKILSVFISSNTVNLLLHFEGNFKEESFKFYPFFQSKEDLEFLIESYLNSLNLEVSEVIILPITTMFELNIFGKKVNYLSNELRRQGEFLYVYFDNLNFNSVKNISASSLGLSKRSDNFISNRSVLSANKFTGDIEEIVYLSKSINDTFKTASGKIIFGGDYFTNPEIPNEFKLNLISEVVSNGFYEIYLDTNNKYPNFLNIRNNSSVNIKPFEFEKFTYLISTDKPAELLLESGRSQKYLEVKLNSTFYLHFTDQELKLKYKGKDIASGEITFDDEFPGLFVDFRTQNDKKVNFGLESFRKVLSSIEKENDYSSL